MIVTLTLSPAVDRILFIPKFTAHSENRVKTAYTGAGGHGINVSRALAVMGTESIACGFIGGQNGRLIKDYLNSVSITHDFVEIAGETRINIKIIDESGEHTDINEAGFTVNDQDFEYLSQRMSKYINHENIIALCGSPTIGFEPEKYAELCMAVTGRGAKLIVDTRPVYLAESLKAKPDFVKPSLSELEAVLGQKLTSHTEIRDGAYELVRRGAKIAAVSMGEDGAIFADEKEAFYVPAPKVDVIDTAGAGAVMVAGACHAISNGMNLEALAVYASAAASASVASEGTVMTSRRQLLNILPLVEASKI